MATQNPFLANWVKNAYSMELGLVPLLEKQTKDVEKDPELQKGLERHLQQTRRHVELLRGCLQRMGENAAGIQPALPFSATLNRVNGSQPDTAQRTELVDYVTEAFEVASYQALSALANLVGDPETARVCQEILQDEQTITRALDQRLPGRMTAARGTERSAEDLAGIARADVDALNAHDLERWMQLRSVDYQSHAPGAAGPMDREQNRAYIQGFIDAFPDLHFEITRVVAQDNHVVVDWTGAGRQDGPLVAPTGVTIPPTHKQCKEFGSFTYEFQNDKIRRTWTYFDMFTLLQQLGVTPGAQQAVQRTFVHVEIPAQDRAVASHFYSEMFGWQFQDEPQFKYTTFRTETIGGGFPELSEMYKPGDIIPYIQSQDIDADLRKAESLGGRMIMPKTEVPGEGWIGIFTDPTGNRIGLWTSSR